MGYRHLIEEETINYFGTKCKFVDVNGVRFYDRNKVEMMTEEEMERCMDEHMLDIMEWDDNHPSLEELGLEWGGVVDFNKIDFDFGVQPKWWHCSQCDCLYRVGGVQSQLYP